LFVFDGTDLGRPFVTHNAEVLSIVARQLEAELLAQLAQRTFRERVKATLKKTLAGQRPELRAVARELGVSRALCNAASPMNASPSSTSLPRRAGSLRGTISSIPRST
jgi:hypothetical protein